MRRLCAPRGGNYRDSERAAGNSAFVEFSTNKKKKQQRLTDNNKKKTLLLGFNR